MRFKYRARYLSFFSCQHFGHDFMRRVIIFFWSFVFKWVTQGHKLSLLGKPSSSTCACLIITTISSLSRILTRWTRRWFTILSFFTFGFVFWYRMRVCFLHWKRIFQFLLPRQRWVFIFTIRIVPLVYVCHHLVSHNIVVQVAILFFSFLFVVLKHLLTLWF
mgnify:CR=1 FL=1